MVTVGTLRNKKFDQFEKELRAIERHKRLMRSDDYYDAHGVPTKNKLLGLDQLHKFAHGNTKQKLTLSNYGQERTYQRRTIQAYKRRLENLIKRTAGGMTLKELLAGVDRKKSKDEKSPIGGTSRKDRIKDIKMVRFVKMLGNIAYFQVSASGLSKGEPSHYLFQVQFNEWNSARGLYSGVRGVNNVLQKPVNIHCSCKDFQFTYGYVATHGHYGIESEQSYPKIRNPKLENTMCKHGGRVSKALLGGEFGLQIALANAMNLQAKKKQNIEQELWAQPEKSKISKKKQKESEFKKKTERKAKNVKKSAQALKKAQQSKAYKNFTKAEKDKLFKTLPKILKKATSSTKTADQLVKDYAEKKNIDPKKAVPFARSGIKDIIDRHIKAASKAVKSAKSKAKSGQEKSAEDAKIRGELIKAKDYREKFGEPVFEQMISDLSKETGKSVSELKKMAE